MKTEVALACVVCCLSWSSERSAAQGLAELQIKVEGNTVRSDGGEQQSAGVSSGALEIGKRTTAGVGRSSRGGCGLDAGARLRSDAIKGWSLEFTPTRVEKKAVSIHVRWTRVDGGKESSPVEADVILRPGESMPLDSIPLTSAPGDTATCRPTAMTVRVKVDYWPSPERDGRLVSTELWLVDRTADGTERTQQLTVRGLPNDSLPFYFAPITEAGVSLDIYGELRASPGQDLVELSLTTRSRIGEAGQSSTIWRDGNMMTSRKIESTLQVKPGEVVSIQLPRLGENQSRAFQARTLSLRVRAQRLR